MTPMMSKFARACAPVLDGQEGQGTVKRKPRRRAVHYRGFRGRPLCVDGDGLGWKLTEDRASVTCRRCLHAFNDPFARFDEAPSSGSDVVPLRYRLALKELGLPPEIEDPPPFEVLETLLDLKRRGTLTREVMEGVADEARKHGLRFGPQE